VYVYLQIEAVVNVFQRLVEVCGICELADVQRVDDLGEERLDVDEQGRNVDDFLEAAVRRRADVNDINLFFFFVTDKKAKLAKAFLTLTRLSGLT